MVELVNITAGGDLGCQIELEQLASDIEAFSIQYNPKKHPGVFIQFEENGPKSTIYRTGSYVITGLKSEDQIDSEVKILYNSIQGIGLDINKDIPEVYNMVFTGDLQSELRLPELAIYLGMNKTEYEPEQSPFLIYRPDRTNCTVTISHTGKAVITGILDKMKASEIFEKLKEDIDELSEKKSC